MGAQYLYICKKTGGVPINGYIPRCSPESRFGRSCAFDGIAYLPDGSGARDMLIVEAGEREEICLADFPIEKLREYRACEVHGNAYRHPRKYKSLVEENIEEPFIRNDYRK